MKPNRRTIPPSRACGALALGLLAWLAACGDDLPGTVRIGVPVSLSGPEASRGQDLLNGALLAVEELNAAHFRVRGKPVRFEIVPKDDKDEAATVTKVAHELTEGNVHAVIGHASAQQTQLAAPIYAACNLPHLFAAGSRQLTSQGAGNTFRLVASDTAQARALAAFAADTLNAERLVAVVEASEYGRDLFDDVAQVLKERRKGIVLKHEVDIGAPIGNEIAARIKDLDGDVILVLGREGHVLSLMEQLKSIRYTGVTVVAGHGAKTRRVSQAEVPIRGLFAATSTVDPSELPAGREFMARFQARYKADPIWGAHYAYDAVYALADVIRQAESVQGPALIAKLKSTESNPPVNYPLRFAPNGEQVYPAISIYKSERGTWVPQMRSASW